MIPSQFPGGVCVSGSWENRYSNKTMWKRKPKNWLSLIELRYVNQFQS